jgi:hypothetical protein
MTDHHLPSPHHLSVQEYAKDYVVKEMGDCLSHQKHLQPMAAL